MEDSEEMTETERKKRHDKKHIGVWKTEKQKRERAKGEENSDKDDDIRSSQDYWEEIGPKMNLNVKMLDKSGVKNPLNNKIN